MKLQLPTTPTLNRAIFGGFACAALMLATGCQTVKKTAPKLALKPKVERKILDPRDSVPPPYVKPRAIVKVRPGAPQPHQATGPRVESPAVTQAPHSSEPVAIERPIPHHSVGIVGVTEVTAAAIQPAPAASINATAAPALAAATVATPATPSTLLPAGLAPVVQATPLELDTAIQAVDISAPAGRELGTPPAAAALAVAPPPTPTEIVLQELPQEPVIEEVVAVTAIADVATLQSVIEEPPSSLIPAAVAPALAQEAELAAPADLGQAPAEIEPLPTYAFKPMTYTVAKGDSLWKIGHTHGVTVAEIASFNNINASRPLKIGQKLELPPGAKFIPAAERPTIKKSKPLAAAAVVKSSKPKGKTPIPSGNVHSVVSGDSLSKIAHTYGVTISQLCELNGLTRQSVLQINQKIKLGQVAKDAPSTQVAAVKPKEKKGPAAVATKPAEKPAESNGEIEDAPVIEAAVAAAVVDTPPEESAATDISKLKTLPHVVGENDTLEIISGMYNSTPAWIKQANEGLKNNADLTSVFKGKEITVPCRGISN
jgi:LysM repeat protein